MLGVSSLAWRPDEDLSIAQMLQESNVSHIDLVPSKYFGWEDPQAEKKSQDLKRKWGDFGIKVRGIQSLLYNAGALNILKPSDWPALEAHFNRVFAISQALGAEKAVFGSPNNRRKGTLPAVQANSLGATFFQKLALQASKYDCSIMLEANPSSYGCDYITTTHEAVDLVTTVDHPNLKAQLDLGTCLINSEVPSEIYNDSFRAFGYVHISAKNLAPVQELPNPHLEPLLKCLPDSFPVSIEMLGDPKSQNTPIVKGAIDWVRNQR